MPQTPHVEKHFTASEVVRDIVIGMSDGLTVPFALAAGLSGAVDATSIVITAGLAEVAAGSIAMGLGGYWPRGQMPNTTPRSGLPKNGRPWKCRKGKPRKWPWYFDPTVCPRRRLPRWSKQSAATRTDGSIS